MTKKLLTLLIALTFIAQPVYGAEIFLTPPENTNKFVTFLTNLFSSNKFGATIYTTALADTIGVFRTNVNDSLTNLNNALATIPTFSYPFTTTSYGGATSTILGFTGGFISTASSTLTSSLTLSTLTSSGLGVTATGLVYSAPTTTYSGGLTYTNGNVVNSGVTSNVAGAGISVSGSTGAVTITNNNLMGKSWEQISSTILSPTTTPMGILVNNSTSTITNLVTVQSTTTNATSTTNYSSGTISGLDKTYGYLGVVSPLKTLLLGSATTTDWTASTSGAYIPFWVATFNGTIRNVRCSTDTSFLGVNIYIGASTSITPSYFVASTTVGTITTTATNTFTAGQIISASFGTTTTSLASKISCSLGITETP